MGRSVDEPDSKRRRTSLSPPSPPPADAPLLPLAASYYDEDEEEMEAAEAAKECCGSGNGTGHLIDESYGSDYSSDGDLAEERTAASAPPAGRVAARLPILGYRQSPGGEFESREVRNSRNWELEEVLDFDFEKFCSVSLSNLNVYACLVCSKYYQGRGRKSHSYTHSREARHHIYINLQTEKVYHLPDGYEINDPSLDDIRHVLNPRFTRDQVSQLDKNKQWPRALEGQIIFPVGLNNIKDTDFVNVTTQSLMRHTPLRNFFFIPENYQNCKSPLVHRFGEFTRKIWHETLKDSFLHNCLQVSPHEFLQAIMKARKKKFRIGVQSDPVEFMTWLLNTLHADLKGSKKKSSTIIHKCFQGELEVIKRIHGGASGERKDEEQRDPDKEGVEEKNIIAETINFPVKNLELKDYITLSKLEDNEKLRSKYDLIASIVHDGKPGEGFYRVFVQRKSEQLWYEMQDLHVAETLPQMFALSEAYMQIYELQQ